MQGQTHTKVNIQMPKRWELIAEAEATDNSYTNKELEEMGWNYELIIWDLNLAEKAWDKISKEIKEELDKYEEDQFDFELPDALANLLPNEIAFSSDCDGYDTCWINKWYIYWKGNKIKYVVLENWWCSTNKYMGNYNPEGTATLGVKIVIYKAIY